MQSRQRTYEAEESEDAGSVLSPEKCIVVDNRINRQLVVKADGLQTSEGSSLVNAMASLQDATGIYRPDHVFKGVTWELGRARCLLERNAGGGDEPA